MLNTCKDCLGLGFTRDCPCPQRCTCARDELKVRCENCNGAGSVVEDDNDAKNAGLSVQVDELKTRIAKLEEAAADTIALECSGLGQDGTDGSTCMTQDEWKDRPAKWCHVCTLARALESETES